MAIEYKRDCKRFRGDIPCRPHKENGVHCEDCSFYEHTDGKILIIKFGAIGDVIRTTPLLKQFREIMPTKEIWWITQYPDILPQNEIDKILTLNIENLLLLEETHFDKVYSLDKDNFACALCNRLNSTEKYGFGLKDGKPYPLRESAVHKYMTGLFDDINKTNRKSYLVEVFELCELEFKGEEYVIDCDTSIKWDIPNEGKKIIGLNTGCGDRWVSRLWSNDNWIKLIKMLKDEGYFPMLLGGKQEDEKNKYFSEQTGAFYPGTFPLKTFISQMNQCDAIVSAVTMGMHLAIGLKKNLILMNNIFNPHEFELYGRGEIVQPTVECTCYFSPKCKNKEYFCMDHITPDAIMQAVNRSFK